MMFFENLILAAEGYLELSMPDDTLVELDKLADSEQERFEALRLRILALLQKKDWHLGLTVSLKMSDLYPKVTFASIHTAYCLHELGKTEEAKQTLLEGPPALLNEAVYYYNLACYEAILGNSAQAKAYLSTSFQLDKSFKKDARKDPDLESIRDSIE
jgi:tetratricopeptide (TPR) repeat protein